MTIDRKIKILEIIGLYEIIGGSIGIGLILYGTIAMKSINMFSILLLLFVLSFYSFSIYAGVQLFKFHEKKIILSEIVQYLQIPAFAILGCYFTLSAGLSFIVGIDYTQEFLFKFNFDIVPSKSSISILSNDKSTLYFYVNLIPILLLYLMDKIQYRMPKVLG